MNEYNNDGVFINLDIEYIPYQKLIFEPEKYLNKHTRYYFKCRRGIKSREVVESLENKGYNVVRVI